MKTIVFAAFVFFSVGINANNLWAAEAPPNYIHVEPDGKTIIVDCPAQGGDVTTYDGVGKVRSLYRCPAPQQFLRLGDIPRESSWKDEFQLQVTVLGGSWIGQGFLTSAQLSFSWFPGAGEHGLRLFGGAGYSFAPFNFLYGLAYQYQPEDKSWSISAGVSSHNLKGSDYRLDWTGLAGLVDARFRLGDSPFSIVAQAHFGVAWDSLGDDDSLTAVMVGLGADGWR